MIWALKLLTKRPSDNGIRISRVVFWLILSFSAYYALIYGWRELETELMFGYVNLSEAWVVYVKYAIASLWLIPLIMWATNICILKSKYMRYVQVFFGIVLFYISWMIVETPALWVDALYWVMWLLPIWAWITWKCITTKCMRFAQKITKIRV